MRPINRFRYFGLLFLIVPYGLLLEDVLQPRTPDESAQVRVLEGVLLEKTFNQRGGPVTYNAIRTDTEFLQFSCRTPAYIKCFPEVANYIGKPVRATVSVTAAGGAFLKKMEDEAGTPLVQEDYLDHRAKEDRSSTRRVITGFNAIGIFLLAIYGGMLLSERLAKRRRPSD